MNAMLIAVIILVGAWLGSGVAVLAFLFFWYRPEPVEEEAVPVEAPVGREPVLTQQMPDYWADSGPAPSEVAFREAGRAG
jgi:hypothetical protein